MALPTSLSLLRWGGRAKPFGDFWAKGVPSNTASEEADILPSIRAPRNAGTPLCVQLVSRFLYTHPPPFLSVKCTLVS